MKVFLIIFLTVLSNISYSSEDISFQDLPKEFIGKVGGLLSVQNVKLSVDSITELGKHDNFEGQIFLYKISGKLEIAENRVIDLVKVNFQTYKNLQNIYTIKFIARDDFVKTLPFELRFDASRNLYTLRLHKSYYKELEMILLAKRYK